MITKNECSISRDSLRVEITLIINVHNFITIYYHPKLSTKIKGQEMRNLEEMIQIVTDITNTHIKHNQIVNKIQMN